LKSSLSSKELLISESEFNKRKKSKTVSYLLFLFVFGLLGEHQFYLGNKKLGWCYVLGLAFTWALSGSYKGDNSDLVIVMM
ncbi:NINE protein, partial [Staphylococcus aureus]